MIYQIDSPENLNNELQRILGQSYSKTKGKNFTSSGSSLYILRKIESESIHINENARCNFEKFQNGILLRINDSQKFYCTPLTNESTRTIIIKRAKERIWPLSLTFFLSLIGIGKVTLKRFWLLSRGFYHERFQVHIKTKSETILLDAHDSCFGKEKRYFEESELTKKLEIRE